MTFSFTTLLVLTLWTLPISEPTSPNPDLTLKNQLRAYFTAPKATDRASLVRSIGENHTFGDVLRGLENLDLWEVETADKSKSLSWTVGLPSGLKAVVQVSGSTDSNAQPAILQFSPHPIPESPTAQARPGPTATWITISPPVGGSFVLPGRGSSDLPDLLREIRKRIHLNRDRVYLFGERTAGDAAWVAAMQYPIEFAGLIVFEGAPRVPYPEQSLALLLPNLRHMPFLSVWTDESAEQPTSQVVILNKAITEFATKAGLTFETATLAPTTEKNVTIPQRLLASAIEKPRISTKDISHWFRYLAQGNAGWIRATDLAGDVWEYEQISISASAKEDYDTFVTQTFKAKMFYLGGKIEGQTITIETQRLGGVEVRLSPEQVDFAKPVSISINGRTRFDGMLEPSITDLLESAYETWDFQHPVYVRKSFSIHSK